MIINTTSPEQKRKQLAEGIRSGKLLQFPGAYNPLVALLIEQKGFDGVYVSGAVMANSLGLPDIGMTTLTEVTGAAASIARVTALPVIMDIDTGFGEPMMVARTIKELHYLGMAGCHIEDQVNPKRCGHLDNKELVSTTDMVKKIKAAVEAKTDPNFLLIARTDAKNSEGITKAIDRAKAYADAGADMIFPEALQDEKEFEMFRKAISTPLLANMTEFGKSNLLTKLQLENIGYNLVIYPVTTQRWAMKAVENGLDSLLATGNQESTLSQMQTRTRLYEVLGYEAYNQYDQSLYNFKLEDDQ
jgi:methylisocitrate lyase